MVAAIVVVSLVAYLPDWLVAFLAVSLLLDRQPPLRRTHPAAPVTVLVAARDVVHPRNRHLPSLAGRRWRRSGVGRSGCWRA